MMSPQFLWDQSPALPAAIAALIWLRLGWGIVLAWCCMQALKRWNSRYGAWTAGGVLAWCCLFTGQWSAYSPVYFLGMVMQRPSIVLVLLCAADLLTLVAKPRPGLTGHKRIFANTPSGWLGTGIFLGWVLLLDSFAMLPWQVYAFGFTPAALAIVTCLGMLPWVLQTGLCGKGIRVWLIPASLLLAVLTRLPTGNIWDAMLDPVLWLGLHVVLLRKTLPQSPIPSHHDGEPKH